MKSTFIWVLRHLALTVGFIWAAEIITALGEANEYSKTRQDPMRTFISAEFATLEITPENFFQYRDSLKLVREQQIEKSGVYDARVYFRDYKQFLMFEVKYRDLFDSVVSLRGMEIASSNATNGLVMLRDKARFQVNADKFEKARHDWFPLDKARDIASAKAPRVPFWSGIAVPMMHWFARFYFKGLPFALLLFLLWKFNLKREFREAVWGGSLETKDAPLSFLISLLFWPIVLAWDIRNRFAEAVKKAEVISTRNKMLSAFSKQEEALLALGKKMGVREFREHLESLGMTRKHSFASALLVLVFLIIIPQSVFPYSEAPCKKEVTIMMKTDYGGGGISQIVFQQPEAILTHLLEVIIYEPLQPVFRNDHWLYTNDVSLTIEKVPWVNNECIKLIV